MQWDSDDNKVWTEENPPHEEFEIDVDGFKMFVGLWKTIDNRIIFIERYEGKAYDPYMHKVLSKELLVAALLLQETEVPDEKLLKWGKDG